MMESEAAEQERLIDAVIGPASEAYYSDRVRSSSAARVRAQAAQSTVTVFSGGLVAAFTFTVLAERPTLIRAAGFVAVVLWLCAGILYLRAVAVPVRAWSETIHVKNRLDLINLVLKKAQNEAEQIDSRQKWANFAVVGAALLTLATFAFFLFSSPGRVIRGEVLVSSKYVAELHKVCPLLTEKLVGNIDTDSLVAQFVEIELPQSVCRVQKFELRIPKGEVLAVGLEGE